MRATSALVATLLMSLVIAWVAVVASGCGTEVQTPALSRSFLFGTLSAANQAISSAFMPGSGYLATATNTSVSDVAPKGLALDPTGQFLYVADSGSSAVSVFQVGLTTGQLSLIETDPAGTQSSAVAVDPTSQYVYVANKTANTLSAFSKATLSGRLTPLATLATGSAPAAVAATAGGFVYVANSGAATISGFALGASGGFSSVGTTAAGITPTALVNHPSLPVLYSVNAGSASVSVYSVDTSAGLLTLLDTVSTGATPMALAVSTAGAAPFAVVANQAAGTLSLFNVIGSGDLVAAGSVSVAVAPTSVAIDPSGKYAFVSGASSSAIGVYQVTFQPLALTLVQSLSVSSAPFAILSGSTYELY